MIEKKPKVNLIFFEILWASVSSLWETDIDLALEKTAQILKKDFSKDEVSIVLTNDNEIQTLNKKFRNKDVATNVLSFPSDEKGELGDILLSYETVQQEAKMAGISPINHSLHLIIHGFLHLLGYDHEDEGSAHQMEALEVQILKELNISNPYEEL